MTTAPLPLKAPFQTPVRLELSPFPCIVAADCELILSTPDATVDELAYIVQCINAYTPPKGDEFADIKPLTPPKSDAPIHDPWGLSNLG